MIMKIPTEQDPKDRITVRKSSKKMELQELIYLQVGTGQDARHVSSRHCHLTPAEAKKVAKALLSYAKKLSN
jgi:hypothetical protein